MQTVALFGAAGKMGQRIMSKLRHDNAYRMLYVEEGRQGISFLRDQGLTASSAEVAATEADVVVLVIPDTAIGKVAGSIVPRLSPGALVVLLDPAAPYSGVLPERDDIAYFVTHPCHPALFNDEVGKARHDFMGGEAKQNIVCALLQGSEEDYRRGEQLARTMFAPVVRAHRISVGQMVILEPAMSETVILTCVLVMKEAIEEAIRHGVPREAAYDFAMGHIAVSFGIVFGLLDTEVSDGAKLAVQRARSLLLQPDWKKVLEPEGVLNEARAIVDGAAEP